MTTPDDAPASAGITPQQVGSVGERLARFHLEAKGCRVVAVNYRCRWGEVDLIARDGLVWVFVEVRTRRSDAYGAPEESITASKGERLTLTAQHFLSQQPDASAETQWRIDLVAVNLGPGRRVLSIRHLENVIES